MDNPNPRGSVELAGKRAASAVLHEILADAIAAFPTALGDVTLPAELPTFALWLFVNPNERAVSLDDGAGGEIGFVALRGR